MSLVYERAIVRLGLSRRGRRLGSVIWPCHAGCATSKNYLTRSGVLEWGNKMRIDSA
jgi:hypothetical protein